MDILLIEDNNSDAFLLKKIFAQNKNAPEVHWVPDGYDALDYVFQRKQYQHAHRPDIILLDLKLPRISGYEVLKDIKGNPSLSTIPIVVLTKSINPLDYIQCKALGADICLAKPKNLKEYENMVRYLLSWTFLHSHQPMVSAHP